MSAHNWKALVMLAHMANLMLPIILVFNRKWKCAISTPEEQTLDQVQACAPRS